MGQKLMPSKKLTRRNLLTFCGLATVSSLSGCSRSDHFGTDNSSDYLVLSLSELDGSLRDRYVVDLTKTRPPWDEEAFNATLNGTTYTTQHHTPFLTRGEDKPTYAERNGTYYLLDSHIIDENTVEHPILRLYEIVHETDDAEVVPHSSLNQVDKQAVQVAWFAARARGNKGGVPGELAERDGYVYRDPDAIKTSDLLDESGPSYVEHRDTVYEVQITRETFHEPVYQPDVDPVADSDAQMETILRAAILDSRISRDELTDEERRILKEAIWDSYSEQRSYSDAYESVLKKLDQWVYLDGDIEKDGKITSGLQKWYLLYDDRYFSYTLQFMSEEPM